jgi:hypothetical protein
MAQIKDERGADRLLMRQEWSLDHDVAAEEKTPKDVFSSPEREDGHLRTMTAVPGSILVRRR